MTWRFSLGSFCWDLEHLHILHCRRFLCLCGASRKPKIKLYIYNIGSLN